MSKKCIVMSLVLVSIIWVAAHSDTVGVYADWAGTNCNIYVNTPGLLLIYVVHVSPAGATSLQFSAPKPACMTGAIWLSDVWPYLIVGNTQTGAAIGYDSCRTGVIPVMYMQYFVQGFSEACCLYPLLPDPHPWVGGQVLVGDCDFNVRPAVGLISTVNGDGSCPCGYPVPVEETTWGQVKALYAE